MVAYRGREEKEKFSDDSQQERFLRLARTVAEEVCADG